MGLMMVGTRVRATKFQRLAKWGRGGKSLFKKTVRKGQVGVIHGSGKTKSGKRFYWVDWILSRSKASDFPIHADGVMKEKRFLKLWELNMI